MKPIKHSQIRIISGRWRGRKLPVPNIEGLRPTPDRVRETVFNWIAEYCRGASVLDCFAGSGALGFEACSREAQLVSLVEKNKQAWQGLQGQLERLKPENAELLLGNVLELIPRLENSYDIVFIDPPYAQSELRIQAVESLIKHGRLNAGALLYLEWPQGEEFNLPDQRVSWLKQKKAGQIHYAIAEWRPSR